jgi:hypothetical protein
MVEDTLKSISGTALQGTGGILLSMWEALPNILRLAILIATFIHIIIKIRKDYEA